MSISVDSEVTPDFGFTSILEGWKLSDQPNYQKISLNAVDAKQFHLGQLPSTAMDNVSSVAELPVH